MVESDITLKLPRAMRSVSTTNNTLKERNSEQPTRATVAGKETDILAPVSPRRQAKPTDEKENGL